MEKRLQLLLRSILNGRFVLLFSLFLITGSAISQSDQPSTDPKNVSGTVISTEDQSPLPGVTVMVKGLSIGTTTDADGRYTINTSEGNVLVFNFVGYLPQEVTVSNQPTID